MSSQCILHYPRFATILADCLFTHKSNIWCLPGWNILYDKLSISYYSLVTTFKASIWVAHSGDKYCDFHFTKQNALINNLNKQSVPC